MPHFLCLLAALTLAFSADHAAAQSPTQQVELKRAVQLDHARITLADVATLVPVAPALAELELGQAPRVGYTARFSREQIAALIARRIGASEQAIAWSGAPSVAVTVQSQEIDSNTLSQAALQAVRAAYASRFPAMSAQAAVPPAAVELPLGEVQIRARALAGLKPAQRMPVWLDLWVGGALYRSVVVPVELKAPQQVYVAVRDVDAGSQVSSADFAVREENVAALSNAPVLVQAGQTAWRLRQPVRAGQVLMQAMLPAQGMVMRGDAVRVIVRSGGIGIEAAGQALADAAPGQRLAVRTGGAGETITGRVSDAGTVVIEAY